MTTVVVIDTNVLVAGLLTSREEAPVARILDGMLVAAFPFAVSTALLAEYRAVLNRPKLRTAHGLSEDEVDALLLTLAEHAIEISPVPATAAPDPGDQHLWDLLAAHADLLLVTGDQALLDAADRHPVISPAEFCSRLEG